MGRIIEGRCVGCGYQARLLVGGGLRDCMAETALTAARGDSALEEMLRGGARFAIRRDVIMCRRCHKLLAAPYVTCWTDEGEARRSISVCPDCGGPPVRLGTEPENLPCPVCGRDMKLVPTGHWD